MGPFLVIDRILFFKTPGCHINLAANYRVDFFVQAGLIKINGPKKHPMIGQRNTFHATLSHCLDQFVDSAKTVQQAIFTMYMKMCKLFFHLFFHFTVKI